MDIDQEVRNNLAKVQEELKEIGLDAKWVEVKSIHLTLKFLGDIHPDDVERIGKTLDVVADKLSPVSLAFAGLGTFPGRGTPRVVFANVAAGKEQIIAFQDKIDSALAELGFARERRRFHPHLTICRLRSSRGLPALQAVLAKNRGRMLGKTEVNAVRFYKSRLTRQGPVYTVLRKWNVAD